MFFKTFDNKEVYYEFTGNEKSGKYLVFLNGIGQSTTAWNQMVSAFEMDYQIVLCDFIFQGQSDKKGEARDLEQHAADVYGLINSLNISKISLVGISFGSLVAQDFALSYPEKLDKLILLSTFAHKTSYYTSLELAGQKALGGGGPGNMFDLIPTMLGSYFENPFMPLDIFRTSSHGSNVDKESLRKLMKASQRRGDYREKLKSVFSPTLIIHGEKDRLVSIQMGKSAANAIQGSKFEIINGAGHILNEDSAPQVIKLMKEFV